MTSLAQNCIADAVLLRALDEELEPSEAWYVKLHLDGCESCQARLEGLRQVSSRVAELHRMALPKDAAVIFQARLESEEAREQREPAWRRWFARPRIAWRQLAWCGAVAVVILAGIRMQTPHSGTPVRPIVHPLARPEAPPAPRQLLAASIPAKAARRTVQKHAPKRPASSAAATAAPEVTTPFFALPFSDAALPLDQAAVIRVEVPRSALELTGLPVAEDRRNERIRADLVLGADGLARAIRFVR